MIMFIINIGFYYQIFFRVFEKEGFLPWVISPNYTGSINPFDILAESELKSK